MPDLDFSITGAEPVLQSLTPQLTFQLHVDESTETRIDAVALRCQIMIDATRRRYEAREQEALLDLFGEPSRWGKTLRAMLWTHASTVVPGFERATDVELVVPCSYDLTVASAKYFYALEDGAIPLNFQFSGTVFHRSPEGDLQVAPISWSKETRFRLPVAVWRMLMDEHHPDSIWVCLQRAVADRLYREKGRRGLPSLDDTITKLLDDAAEVARP